MTNQRSSRLKEGVVDVFLDRSPVEGNKDQTLLSDTLPVNL